MTTYKHRLVKCVICGMTSEYPILASTSTFGPPDLDLRPPELKRSTIWLWAQRCPTCGYCAGSVDERIEGAEAVVSSDAYRRIEANELTALAATFLREALILENAGRLGEAGWATVHAAWTCDDEALEDRARQLRLLAVERFRRARAADQRFVEQDGAEDIVLADLLRRSASFDEAAQACEQARAATTDPDVESIALFIIDLCTLGDDQAHSLEDGLGRAEEPGV